MDASTLATALRRAQAVFRQRPATARSDDAPASARWDGGTRVVARHPSGVEVTTDLPASLGGRGDGVAPGWLLRAALASCAATRIAMDAALHGIVLAQLDVDAHSRSDTRGLLGMADDDGAPVPAGPSDVRLVVRIRAPGVPPAQLDALVRRGVQDSPVGCTLGQAVPVALQVDIVD